MKQIIKNQEPKSLLEHRLQPFADYDNYPQKEELRDSLLTEQGQAILDFGFTILDCFHK